MSLPKLLQTTRQKITLPAAAAAMGGGPETSATLSFSQQTQQQNLWCWAAVTVSVSLFYNAGSGWSQCSLVNAELGRSDCCFNGGLFVCYRTSTLDAPLSRAGNLYVVGRSFVAVPACLSVM